MSVRAVSDALKHLRELGLLHRIRRCVEDWQDGRFRLRQETNAYVLLAEETYWQGWRPPAEPPAPAPGTWADFPPASADRRRPGGLGDRSCGEGGGAQT